MPNRLLTLGIPGGRLLRKAEAAWKASRYSGSGALLDLTGRGHDAQLGSTSGADTNDPLFLSLVSGRPYLYSPGLASNSATVPDAANLRITGDISIRQGVQATALTGRGTLRLAEKGSVGGNTGWILRHDNTGKIELTLSNDGTATTAALSSVAAGSSANGIRADWRASDGRVQFFTCTDYNGATGAGTWVQLGTDQSIVYASIFASTALLIVVEASGAEGNYFGFHMFADITGTDRRVGVDFTDLTKYDSTRTSLTAVTGQTVTINRATSGRKSVVVDRPLFSLGTDDYLEIADHAALNFALTESFTVLIAVRQHATPVSNGTYITKKNVASNAAAGWQLVSNGTNLRPTARIGDGTLTVFANPGTPFTAGAVVTLGLRRIAGVTLGGLIDGVETTAADSLAATLTNSGPLRIGANSTSLTNVQDFEFIGAAIFRRALSDSEITRATAELLAA
jgi:hypothetical protein